MRWVTGPVGALFAPTISGAAAHAQSRVVGRVLDHESGRPIPGAAVRIVTYERTIATNDQGMFLLRDLAAGTLVLRFESIGYLARTDSIQVSEDEALTIEARLSRTPIELPPLAVTVESPRLAEVGFYDRKLTGGLSGHYITRAEIEQRRPRGLTDLFYNIPATHVTYNGPGERVIRFRRRVGGFRPGHPDGCVPDLYVDGVRLQDQQVPRDDFYNPRLKDYDVISPNNIEGIEVYVGSLTPIQYKHQCGVILIWTRR